MSALTVLGVVPFPLEIKVLNMLSSQGNFLRLVLNLRAGNTMESSYIAFSSTQSTRVKEEENINGTIICQFSSLQVLLKTEPANVFGSSPHSKDTYSSIGWSEVMTFPFI